MKGIVFKQRAIFGFVILDRIETHSFFFLFFIGWICLVVVLCLCLLYNTIPVLSPSVYGGWMRMETHGYRQRGTGRKRHRFDKSFRVFWPIHATPEPYPSCVYYSYIEPSYLSAKIS